MTDDKLFPSVEDCAEQIAALPEVEGAALRAYLEFGARLDTMLRGDSEQDFAILVPALLAAAVRIAYRHDMPASVVLTHFVDLMQTLYELPCSVVHVPRPAPPSKDLH